MAAGATPTTHKPKRRKRARRMPPGSARCIDITPSACNHSNPVSAPRDAIEPGEGAVRGERALWAAVLLQQIVDSKSQNRTNRARYDAITANAWLNIRNPDFRTVCEWAGYCPHEVSARLAKSLTHKG